MRDRTASTPKDRNQLRVIDLERAVLRALCTQPFPRSAIEAGVQQLADYSWQSPDHAVVYSAIVRSSKRDPPNWRSHLPAQTTRMGFPDINWEALLKPYAESASIIEELIRELKSSAEPRP